MALNKVYSDGKSVRINPGVNGTFDVKVQDAAKVSTKKTKTDNRNQITTFIHSNLKSRQEFKQLIGKYINCAKAEPLHLKNNIIKEQFIKFFKICLANKSDLKKATSYKDIPETTLFVSLVKFVHEKMGCNFLSKKVISWLNDNSGKVERLWIPVPGKREL